MQSFTASMPLLAADYYIYFCASQSTMMLCSCEVKADAAHSADGLQCGWYLEQWFHINMCHTWSYLSRNIYTRVLCTPTSILIAVS